MNLYVDAGNTNIKFNFNINNKEYYYSLLSKEKYSIDTLFNSMPKIIKENKIEKIFICSTIPFLTNLLEEMSKKYFQLKPIILSIKNNKKILINIENPKEIGNDLIALGHFLRSKSKNAIMVNMGTSTTIIKVKDNKLMGVIISCGLEIQIQSLIENAFKLNEIDLKIMKEKNIGKNTKESMSIGIMNGHGEMIKSLVKKIDDNSDKYISGGHSKKMKDFLNDFKWIKEATIEGMKEMVKYFDIK